MNLSKEILFVIVAVGFISCFIWWYVFKRGDTPPSPSPHPPKRRIPLVPINPPPRPPKPPLPPIFHHTEFTISNSTDPYVQGYVFGDNYRFATTKAYTFAFEIKTRESDCFILSLNAEVPSQPFLYVYIADGAVVFVQGTPHSSRGVRLETPKWFVSDGKWHSIRIIRMNSIWTLQADSLTPIKIDRTVDTVPVNTLYIGDRPLKLRPTFKGFNGCIRNVLVNGQLQKDLLKIGQVSYGCLASTLYGDLSSSPSVDSNDESDSGYDDTVFSSYRGELSPNCIN